MAEFATTVRERPIIFSGPMVRAIIEGRKTQTRRVIDLSRPLPGARLCRRENLTAREIELCFRCPYGVPGDLLWVRETWGWSTLASMPPSARFKQFIEYKADGPRTSKEAFPNLNPPLEIIAPRWRPSIHMPRWASRLTLRVTGVRVERLQEISEADAVAEGCHVDHLQVMYTDGTPSRDVEIVPARLGFSALWDSINGKRHPWASNSWVWVVGFEKVEVRRV